MEDSLKKKNCVFLASVVGVVKKKSAYLAVLLALKVQNQQLIL